MKKLDTTPKDRPRPLAAMEKENRPATFQVKSNPVTSKPPKAPDKGKK